jgi:hypothetical protein
MSTANRLRCPCGFDFAKAVAAGRRLKAYAAIPDEDYEATIRKEWAILSEKNTDRRIALVASSSRRIGSLMLCPESGVWLLVEPRRRRRKVVYVRQFASFCFALVVAVLLFPGCAHQDRGAAPIDSRAEEVRPSGARLSAAEAIRLATAAATHAGIPLREFKAPTARCETIEGRKVWWVSFDGKVAKPGHHFSVRVEDQTGETRIFGGA